jgi:hypothetical protein
MCIEDAKLNVGSCILAFCNRNDLSMDSDCLQSAFTPHGALRLDRRVPPAAPATR